MKIIHYRTIKTSKKDGSTLSFVPGKALCGAKSRVRTRSRNLVNCKTCKRMLASRKCAKSGCRRRPINQRKYCSRHRK